MEKLIMLRMFFFFPLFGLILLDTGILLSGNLQHIPLTHIGSEIATMFCILICTLLIVSQKKREHHIGNKTNGPSYS